MPALLCFAVLLAASAARQVSACAAPGKSQCLYMHSTTVIRSFTVPTASAAELCCDVCEQGKAGKSEGCRSWTVEAIAGKTDVMTCTLKNNQNPFVDKSRTGCISGTLSVPPSPPSPPAPPTPPSPPSPPPSPPAPPTPPSEKICSTVTQLLQSVGTITFGCIESNCTGWCRDKVFAQVCHADQLSKPGRCGTVDFRNVLLSNCELTSKRLQASFSGDQGQGQFVHDVHFYVRWPCSHHLLHANSIKASVSPLTASFAANVDLSDPLKPKCSDGQFTLNEFNAHVKANSWVEKKAANMLHGLMVKEVKQQILKTVHEGLAKVCPSSDTINDEYV